MPPAFVIPPLGPVVVGIELIDIVVGLAVTLVVLSGWVFLALVGPATAHIPVIGGTISGILGVMEHWWKRGSLNVIKGSIGQVLKLARALWSVVSLVWTFIYVVQAVVVTLVRHLDATAQHSSADVAALRAQEQADVQTIDRYIENAQAQITQNLITEKADFGQAQANAISYTDDAVAREAAREGVDVSNLQGNINANFNTVESQLTFAQTQLQNNINHVYDLTQADLANATNTLHNQITNGVTTAEQYATGLVSGLGIGAITSTLTALQGQVQKIATDTTECLDPLCDTVTPQAKRLGNLGKIFQGLEDLALVAFLFGLCEEGLHHPEAVVEDTVSVYNAVLEPVVTAFRDAVT